MPEASVTIAPLTKGGGRDLVEGLLRAELWGRLGWLEVKRRYRRTTIGPFWSVISLAVFVIGIGGVGAGLWNQNLSEYLPYLTAGMLAWIMISTTVTEACSVFAANSSLFRHSRFDFSVLAYAAIWRNFIVFLHHLPVYAVLVLVLAPHLISPASLLIVPGLALLMVNGVWIVLLLGMFCLRFRDVQQLVTSLMQIAMFMTPIFWPMEQLQGARRLFVHLNPLYHCVEMVRAPLLGKAPTAQNYIAVMLIAVVGWVITYVAFQRFRRRITYWS